MSKKINYLILIALFFSVNAWANSVAVINHTRIPLTHLTVGHGTLGGVSTIPGLENIPVNSVDAGDGTNQTLPVTVDTSISAKDFWNVSFTWTDPNDPNKTIHKTFFMGSCDPLVQNLNYKFTINISSSSDDKSPYPIPSTVVIKIEDIPSSIPTCSLKKASPS